MKPQLPKNKWFYAFVIALAVAVAATVVAIVIGVATNRTPGEDLPGDDIVIPEGPETGIYYYDNEGEEYSLQLYSGNKFIYNDGVSRIGEYTVDGSNLTFTFDKGNNGTATAVYADGVVTMIYGDTSIRFLRKIDYTVSFDSNGANADTLAKVTNGKTVAAPADPVREGYIFIGWYADKEMAQAYAFTTPVTADTTIYAGWVEKGVGPEYTLTFVGADYAAKSTVGGKAFMLPTPEDKDGYTFGGWWISMYEDGEKLSYKCEENTPINANTTLFALWIPETTDLAAPVVNVSEQGLKWDTVKGATAYAVKITAPSGEVVFEDNVSQTAMNFDFAVAGGYTIEVTATAPGSKTSATTERYYNAKALPRVSVFEVVNNVLVFNAVEGAEKYYITVECGNQDHNHTYVNNGKSTVYNFSNCPMVEGGIKFTVTATAKDYADSVSTTFVYERKLDQVEGVKVENGKLVWTPVKNAMGYEVVIVDAEKGTTTLLVNGTVVDLKNYAGEINVVVTPVTEGYVSPEGVTYKYEKAELAAPADVTVNGNVITWTAVTGAEGYVVKIGAVEFETAEARLDLAAQEFTANVGEVLAISVKAISATNASAYSDVAEAIYQSFGGDVYYENGYVYWTPVVGNGYYEVKVGNGVTFPVYEGNCAKVVFTAAGATTVSVRYVENKMTTAWINTEVMVYSVVFDSRLGSAVDPLYLALGDTIVLPEDVERPGYDFNGWYNTPGAAAGNGMLFTSATFAGSDGFVLYANWDAKTYNITISVDEGVNGALSGEVIGVKFGKNYKMPIVTSDAGVFMGWFSAPGGAGIQLTDDLGDSLGKFGQLVDINAHPYFITDVLAYVELDDGTYAVKKGVNAEKIRNIFIPDTYNGQPITQVLENAFLNCADLKTISIPNTVKMIGVGALTSNAALENIEIRVLPGNHEVFYYSYDGALIYDDMGTKYLEFFPRAKTGEYTIPNTVSSISRAAFRYAYGLEKVTVSKSVTYISEKAFYKCTALTQLVFEEGGEQALEIVDNAFMGLDKLSELHLPARLGTISSVTLDALTALTFISVEDGGETYGSVAGLLTNGAKDTIIYAPASLTGANGAFSVPVGITGIADHAFYNRKNLTTITISNKIVSIGASAFENCTGVTKVVFEGGRNSDLVIGEAAFKGCAALRGVEFKGGTSLDEGIITIGASAFENAPKLNTLVFDPNANIYEIGARAFADCSSIPAVVVSASTAVIGDSAYAGCSSVTNVTFAEGGKEIEFGSSVFAGCAKLTSIYLPATVTVFDGSVFDGCDAIREIVVDANNPALVAEDGVLYDKNKTEIMYFPRSRAVDFAALPTTLVKIGAAAFQNNPNITVATIPTAITEIGDKAFDNCINLTNVVFNGNESMTIGAYAFSRCPVLTGINMPANTTQIGDYAFYMSGLTAVTIPAEVTEIGDFAFSGTKIATVVIPGKVTNVGDGAFSTCRELETVTFEDGENALTIGNLEATDAATGAFSGCSKLATITLSANVEIIGTNTFKGVSTLTTVHMPSTGAAAKLTAIGEFAFANTGIAAIALPEGLVDINAGAFSGATKLAAIKIPGTVASIGLNAFDGAAALNKVEFVDSEVELTINDYAFKGAAALQSITLPARLVKIYDATTVGKAGYAVTTFYTVFDGCSSLAAINVDPGNVSFASVDGVFYEKDLEGNPSILIYCPRAKAGTVTVPSTVVLVHNMSFVGTAVEHVIFEEKIYAEGEEIIPTLEIGTTNYNAASAPNDYIYSVFGSSSTVSGSPSSSATSNYYYEKICNLTLKSISFPAHLKAINTFAVTHIATENFTVTFNREARDVEIANYAFYFNGVQSARTNTGLTGQLNLPKVSKIGNYAFYYCNLVTGVDFAPGSTITTLGEYAFSNTKIAAATNIPKTLTTIGSNCFNYSQLNTMTYEDGECNLTTLGMMAFGSTKFTSFTFPESLTSIGSAIFSGSTTLTTVTLPTTLKSGVATDGGAIFQNISSLKQIIVPEENPYLCAVGGVLYSKDMTALICVPTKLANIANYTIPSTVTSIEAYALHKYAGTKLVLPDGLIRIGRYAVQQSSTLTSIEIPATVTEIDEYAFGNCSKLVTVTFAPGSQLKTIGNRAFYSCAKLAAIELPDTVETMGTYVFSSSKVLASVKLSSSLKSIPNQAFYGCSALADVTMYEGLETIELAAFSTCTSLKTITIPASVKKINSKSGSSATFNGCSALTTVIFAEGSQLQEILDYAFRNCTALEEITIPAGVSELPNNLFNGCSKLKSVTLLGAIKNIPDNFFKNGVVETVVLPDTIETIGAGAFLNCAKLTSVNFPASIVSIGDNAFQGCVGITSVYLGDSVEYVGNYAFDGCSGITSVTFGPGCALTALGTDPKVEAATFRGTTSLTEIALPDTIATMGANVFQNSGIASVKVPANLTAIGDYTFAGCVALTYVNVPDSIMEIGNFAFMDCAALKTVDLALGVESIGSGVFMNCTALESTNIPLSVIHIEGNPFVNCPSLSNMNFEAGNTAYVMVDGALYDADMYTLIMYLPGNTAKTFTLPETVYEIADGAFYGSKLESFVIPGNIKNIPDMLFMDSKNLKSVVIPRSVTTIGSSAFEGCEALAAVTIPSSATSIGDSAFLGCVSLADVTIEESNLTLTLGADLFNGCASLTGITIPASVTALADRMFMNTGLTAIALPNSITSLDYEKLFYGCNDLAQVTLPANATGKLGNYFFAYCSSLENIVLPVGINAFVEPTFFAGSTLGGAHYTDVVGATFLGCTALKSIDVSNIIAFGAYTFSGCSALEEITFGTSGELFGDYCFEGCTSLTNVDMSSITQVSNRDSRVQVGLGVGLFKDCTALVSVHFPKANAEYIRERIFEGCTSLIYAEFHDFMAFGKYEKPFENLTSATTIKFTSSIANYKTMSKFVEAKKTHTDYFQATTPKVTNNTQWYQYTGAIIMGTDYMAVDNNGNIYDPAIDLVEAKGTYEYVEEQEGKTVTYTVVVDENSATATVNTDGAVVEYQFVRAVERLYFTDADGKLVTFNYVDGTLVGLGVTLAKQA